PWASLKLGDHQKVYELLVSYDQTIIERGPTGLFMEDIVKSKGEGYIFLTEVLKLASEHSYENLAVCLDTIQRYWNLHEDEYSSSTLISRIYNTFIQQNQLDVLKYIDDYIYARNQIKNVYVEMPTIDDYYLASLKDTEIMEYIFDDIKNKLITLKFQSKLINKYNIKFLKFIIEKSIKIIDDSQNIKYIMDTGNLEMLRFLIRYGDLKIMRYSSFFSINNHNYEIKYFWGHRVRILDYLQNNY
ncbi:MAG TPA: hypothetical protein VKR58_12945, partial [Aquella sp.]|nr:hypothetical protein [Aquella sp.]